MNASPPTHPDERRIGHGYDLHRLEPVAPAGAGRPFVLAGVPFEHDLGPVGHSDADALFHAVTDALLGALALPDIGQLFPDTDPRHDNADSGPMLDEAVRLVREAGWAIENVDATVVLERPKVNPVKGALRESLARRLGVVIDRVNVKGKTHEGVGELGAGLAVEVHALALLCAARGGGSP